MRTSNLNKINSEKTFLKYLNVVGPIASILLVTLPFLLFLYARRPQKLPIGASFTKNNQTFQLEIATKPSELSKGLKFRKSIPENTGMLFVINRAEPIRLWMKETYIPLDMIFMRDGVVNDIVHNAVPCKRKPCPAYGGKFPSNQIIEVPAGKASELGIKVKDRINIEFSKAPSN